MIGLSTSRIRNVVMGKLSASVTSMKEGALAVYVMEGGTAVVKPSAGAAGEVVAGIAQSQVMDASVASKVESFTVPVGGGAVTLAKTPNGAASEIGVFVLDAAGVVTAAMAPAIGAAAAGAPQILAGSRTMTFAVADAGKIVRVVYRYAVSLAEARLIFGQGIGDGAQSDIGGTAIINQADVVYTDQYDTTDDWSTIGPVYTGANGMLTKKTTGTLIAGMRIVAAPGNQPGAQHSAMLGVAINIA